MDYYESESLRHIVARVQSRHPGVVQDTATGDGGVPGTSCGLWLNGEQVAWVAAERQAVSGDRPRLLYRWGVGASDMRASDAASEAASALVRLVSEHRSADPEYHHHVRAIRGAVLSMLDDAEHGVAPLATTQAALMEMVKVLHDTAALRRGMR